MPKLRQLSSTEVIKSLENLGFEVTGQKGSHVKLARYTVLEKQVLTVPNNKSLSKGMLKAIFNQASKFIPQEQLLQFFYTE